MTRSPIPTHETIFFTCRRTLGSTAWGRVLAAMEENSTPEFFADRLATLTDAMDLPGYLTDLARL